MNPSSIWPGDEIPEDVFASVLYQGQVGLWELKTGPKGDLQGAVIIFDQSARDLFVEPSSPQELVFLSFIETWIHPADQVMARNFMESLLKGADSFNFEARFWLKGLGDWTWGQILGRPFAVMAGAPTRVFGLVKIVHERRLSQEALKQAILEKDETAKDLILERERLAAVIEAGELGTWDWEIQTGQVIYNRHWARIIGRELSEISSDVNAWENSMFPEDYARAYQAVEDHCLGLTPSYECEFRLRHKNGSTVWAQDKGRVVERDERGQAKRLIGVMIDVSKQKLIERSLAENNDQLELIFKAARIGAWDWDVAKGTLKFNDVYLDMLGYAPDEITGTIEEWESFVHPDELEATNAALERALSGQEDMYAAEIRMRHKDGHYVWTYDFGRVVTRDERGAALRMIGGHFDFDERKKMEMEYSTIKEQERELKLSRDLAEESARAKSEFLANMSHEIRTPMNAIIGLTHLVLETELDEQQADYIKRAEMAAQALLRIINDILDFSKIEAGKLEMEETAFQLVDCLNAVLSILEVKAVEKGLTFKIIVDQEVPSYYLGDPVRLSQILNNLVSNAIKFTSEGSITVNVALKSLTEEEAFLLFKVIDTGIGLSEEQLKTLFTAFTQADTSITRRYGGTGLGLTISKRLVEMMGGQIWCESILGVGSQFSFTTRLKLFKGIEPQEEKVKTLGLVSEGLESVKGAKILLTEDNEVNQLVASRILAKAGFEVKIANNGLEAVSMVRAEPFDLVLMDIQMPEMDGLTATKTIRAIPGFERIPIVAMTAHAMSGDRELSLAAGMNDHISKPINIQELYQALIKWTRTKKRA
ncbi:MAG: PAS domain-containing protein [Deltaproteobacteria bacterium]|jgi:PAS domain S-box-containing protein|nr:PAS domain-containing protein [Deltaproteobacteria bacterium]